VWVDNVLCVSAIAAAPGLDTGSDPQIWPLLLKMLAALAIVLGVMFLLSAGLRRLRWGRGKAGQESIEIQETRPLGAKKMLCLVNVRDRQMLLGITPDRITFLSHIDPPESKTSFAQAMDRQKDTRT
jgi:flagellar protein FliO/FliZ